MTDLKPLRKEAHGMTAILQIGKFGLTENMVKEVKVQLKKRPLIKIKMLKAAQPSRKLAEELAEQTSSVLVSFVGGTAVLARKGYKGKKPRGK